MILIKNDYDFLVSDVGVEIQLPAVPRKGEILYLTDEQIEVLENKAKSDLKIAKYYAPKWFYGDSRFCKEPKQENLQDLSFSDAMYVKEVVYYGNSEIIKIELDDDFDDDIDD
jgi:hypothetical protein